MDLIRMGRETGKQRLTIGEVNDQMPVVFGNNWVHVSGFEKGRCLDKMGLHGQDTAELSFVDCRVPAANLLGNENEGFYYTH